MTNAYGLPFLRGSAKTARPNRFTPWDDESEPVKVVPLPGTKLSHDGQTYLIRGFSSGSRFVALPEPVSRPAV